MYFYITEENSDLRQLQKTGLFIFYKFNPLQTSRQNMYRMFNVQHLRSLPKMYLFVLYFSEIKQRTVLITT